MDSKKIHPNTLPTYFPPFGTQHGMTCCVMACAYLDFGHLHKRRTHSQSHSWYVQQHYVQQNSTSLRIDHRSENHSVAASVPKWLMLVDLPLPLGPMGTPMGTACPEDSQVSGSVPFGAFNLSKSSSTDSWSQGRVAPPVKDLEANSEV